MEIGLSPIRSAEPLPAEIEWDQGMFIAVPEKGKPILKMNVHVVSYIMWVVPYHCSHSG